MCTSIPAVVVEAGKLDEPEQSAKVDEWVFQLQLLRADLALYGPHLDRLAEKVGDGLERSKAEYNTFVAAAPPGTSDEAATDSYRRRFKKYVVPALEELAAAMAEDADLR